MKRTRKDEEEMCYGDGGNKRKVLVTLEITNSSKHKNLTKKDAKNKFDIQATTASGNAIKRKVNNGRRIKKIIIYREFILIKIFFFSFFCLLETIFKLYGKKEKRCNKWLRKERKAEKKERKKRNERKKEKKKERKKRKKERKERKKEKRCNKWLIKKEKKEKQKGMKERK